MSDEVETMMYVGATPWHGLGTRLATPPADVVEALKMAGLDWTVALEQLQTAAGKLVDSYAVVRSKDGAVLGHGVSARWTPVQHCDGFAFFDPFIASGAATIETAGSLRGGARVWMLAKIDRPDSVIVRRADDRVAKYLLIAMGHDGHMSVRVLITPIRVVCMNTLRASLAGGNAIRIPHTKNAMDALANVQKTIMMADEEFEKGAKIFRALAGVQVKEEQLKKYVDAVFKPAKAPDADAALAADDSFASLMSRPANLRDPVVGDFMTKETKARVYAEVEQLFTGGRGNNLPGVKGTGWAAYNAVTEYNSWKRGRTADARLDALWLKDSGPVSRALPAAVDTFLRN